MVANEFELLQAGCNQSKSAEDEVGPLQKANDWHLLYPEAVQDVNTEGSSLDTQPICHQEDVHKGHVSHYSEHSVDAVAEVSSLVSTSSLSESESEDVILVDIGLGETATSNFVAPSEFDETHLAFKDKRSSSAKPVEPKNKSNSHCAFLVSESTCKAPLINTPFPMHNPPAQVMERDEVYDPQRIPASVFARSESGVPADWSIASNESLFSLQVGNTSISREQALLLSGELERLTQLSKAGELSPTELKELRKLAGLTKSGESLMSSPPPPTISEVGEEGEAQEANNLQGQEEPTVAVKEEKSILQKKEERHQHWTSSTNSSNLSRPSDVSEGSTYSFAFPILGQGEKTAAAPKQSQWQLGPHWQANSSLVTSEPVTPGKRRCFDCFSCCRYFSCNHFCSWGCCSSCSHFFCCCHCFSCSLSCSCCSCKSCWRPKCC